MLYLHYLFDFVVKFQCKFFKKARLVRARTRQLVKVSGRPVLKLVIILREYLQKQEDLKQLQHRPEIYVNEKSSVCFLYSEGP